MAGGLIQIATYGSQDLYLTGTPEITFFKVVYRRHTNFSIESIRVPFDDSAGFGKNPSITIPKIGDLVHKIYLEVLLPEINFQRFDPSNDLKPQVDQAEQNYEIVTTFMSLNRRAYVSANDIFIAQNSIQSQPMLTAIDTVFTEPTAFQKIEDFQNLMTTTPDAPFSFGEVSLKSVGDSLSPVDSKDIVFAAISVAIDKSIKVQNYFFQVYRDIRNQWLDDLNANLKFAWVQRIGHAILDTIELNIGGHIIDRQYGDWINIWYELSANRSLEKVYFEMIGNVPILTDFDRVPKPKYLLRIPLQFWFCRHSGLALPLVSMQYHDAIFHVKFKKIEDVSYIEAGKLIKINDTNEGIMLDEVPAQLNIDIQSNFLVDYIYLDGPERRRFAQSAHEYLIEQIQVLEIRDIQQPKFDVVLNNFVHPVKEMIWVSQKERYTENLDGYNQCRWNNYSLTDDNKGNPISFSQINFHSYVRSARLDGNYYNYVQPWETHTTTPSDGINMYSFSIFPEDSQPSGSANFSRLSRVTLFLEFAGTIEGNLLNEPLILRIYVRNLNILRFVSGMAGTAYTYG